MYNDDHSILMYKVDIYLEPMLLEYLQVRPTDAVCLCTHTARVHDQLVESEGAYGLVLS